MIDVARFLVLGYGSVNFQIGEEDFENGNVLGEGCVNYLAIYYFI